MNWYLILTVLSIFVTPALDLWVSGPGGDSHYVVGWVGGMVTTILIVVGCRE